MQCIYPFEVMYLHSGFVTTCCPNWLDWYKWSSAPNRYASSPEKLWGDSKLEELRDNVTGGDYNACQVCPVYLNRHTDHAPFDTIWKEPKRSNPSVLYIADSFVCNLQCWSCRSRLITVDENSDQKQKLLWKVMEAFAPDLKMVNILGSGEVFASARHMKFLREFEWGDYPNLDIEIISNATLLEQRWGQIAPAHGSIRHMSISIDAATEETYERVRKGGEWADVISGFDFAASLGFDRLQATFVARAANFHEMADFAKNMLERGATTVMFTQLAQSYLTKTQYISQNVFDRGHPKHKLLLEHLEDPIFRDERVCLFTSLK